MPRLRLLVVLALVVSLCATACAASPARSTVTPEADVSHDFPSATAFVQHLASPRAARTK